MASTLADRLDYFAEGIRARIGIDSVADELRAHAADVRTTMESYEREYQLLRVRIADLEAREQARLKDMAYSTKPGGERRYSASPTGCGELEAPSIHVTGICPECHRPSCEGTHREPPGLVGFGGGGLHPDATIHPVTGTNVMPGSAAVIDHEGEELP